ncbi:MAG: hypothetical protein ACJAS3_001747 [Roseivirga sp.]
MKRAIKIAYELEFICEDFRRLIDASGDKLLYSITFGSNFMDNNMLLSHSI